MRRIGLIGSIGNGKQTSSGQTIRTRILLSSLKSHYGNDMIQLCDTDDATHNTIKFLIHLLLCLIKCKDIVLIVSRNGLRVFLPILSFAQEHLGKRIYNNIIGGNIIELIDNNANYPKYMKTFCVNWVQMQQLVEQLKAKGIHNAEVLPNSKPLRIVQESELPSEFTSPLSFCTFSRISKAKGIELAIQTIERINSESQGPIAELTIYGNPDEDYQETFDALIKRSTNMIHYGGIIPFDKATDVLKQYYMLLFPTTFYGEGFPGTILDAYASGLPVLASDWKFNPDLIEEGVTGFLYDHASENDFEKKLRYVIGNKEEVCALRKNCLKEADKYTAENVMPIIFNKIDSLRGEKK